MWCVLLFVVVGMGVVAVTVALVVVAKIVTKVVMTTKRAAAVMWTPSKTLES